jgi:hypothetical protein
LLFTPIRTTAGVENTSGATAALQSCSTDGACWTGEAIHFRKLRSRARELALVTRAGRCEIKTLKVRSL